MQTVTTLTALTSSLAGLSAAALWLVWLRDKKQMFARDVALWFLAGMVLPPFYYLWRLGDPFNHWVGFFGVAISYALAHTFLIVGVRRFASEKTVATRYIVAIAVSLSALYCLVLLTPYAVQTIGAVSTVVAWSAGI